MRIQPLSIIAILALGLFFTAQASAQYEAEDASAFSLRNPDGIKYDFAKAYISALEHLYQNETRQKQASEINGANFKDPAVIAGERDRLTNANVNLRIARNLLERFERSNNGLINNVVEKFSAYADKQVELNNQERLLLETIRTKIIDEQVDESVIKWYGESVTGISSQRKESSKQLLESSLLVGKVLISHQFNVSGRLYKLGVTKEERRNLLQRLRLFSDESFKGEMRSGQTFLEASVSSIRQVLEDTRWPSDEEI